MATQKSGYMANDPAGAGENRIEEGRGIPQVGKKKSGANAATVLGFMAVALAVILMAGFLVFKKLQANKTPEQPKIEAEATSTLPSLTADAFKAKSEPPQAPPSVTGDEPSRGGDRRAQREGLSPEEKAAKDREERRKRAPVVAFSKAAKAAGGVDTEGAAGGAGGSLGRALQATRMEGVSARTLADPSLTITQGTFIDCALKTAINSTLPGMTSCQLSRDVYSTDGRVLLLERGSLIVGQYQSAQLRQGMRRIFMLWTRIETPNGVLINLDSPATDSLGRSGVDGRVNNHFWLRFGSAMLVSLVDDLVQYGADQSSDSSDGTSITFGSSSESGNRAAEIIVENTVNIPPTLEKNQGAHVGIFVARDLYFGSVYALSPRG